MKEVTTQKAYVWDPENKDSRDWDIPSPSQKREGGAEGAWHPLPEARHRIVAYDFGGEAEHPPPAAPAGFPCRCRARHGDGEGSAGQEPRRVFSLERPGDPAALDYIHREVKQLVGKKPIFAICLGHQILGHVFGGKTFKLKFGHRGGNQPVKDLRSGKVAITAQNHGFAIDPDSLPANVEVTHVNLNDGTVEGLRHRDHPVLSVQYHPEAAPGPNDAKYFFSEFERLIESSK